jgi:hypothetical protein
MQVTGVPAGAARCGVAPGQRPTPLTHEHVDRWECRIPLVRQHLAGLYAVPVGLQEHDIVAQPDQLIHDRPTPKTPPVGRVHDP